MTHSNITGSTRFARSLARPVPLLLGAALFAGACGKSDKGGADSSSAATSARTSADSATAGNADSASGASPRLVASVENLKNPESVKWDSALGVWFVSNVNGNPNAKDNNGFISRLRRDGTAVDAERNFIAAGRNGVTLNAPKGMAVVGDTLVVADIDAVRMFNARTGAPVASVNLAPLGATFLNDVAVGGDGALYITDTGIRISSTGQMSKPGRDRVFKIVGRKPSVAITDTALAGPNGITWDRANNRFIVVGNGGKSMVTWKPGSAPAPLAEGPGQFDGVEVLPDGRVLVSSWADSSVYVERNGTMTKLIGGVASPADIGVDPSRSLVAIPQLMLNQVQVYQIGR
jgi:sugar lactone lactonase YvrE